MCGQTQICLDNPNPRRSIRFFFYKRGLPRHNCDLRDVCNEIHYRSVTNELICVNIGNLRVVRRMTDQSGPDRNSRARKLHSNRCCAQRRLSCTNVAGDNRHRYDHEQNEILTGCIALIGCVGNAIALTAEEAKAQVITQEKAWSDAVIHHDIAKVASILADDFVGIDGRGFVSDKAAELKEAAPPAVDSTAP
jgi:hypothetical protein